MSGSTHITAEIFLFAENNFIGVKLCTELVELLSDSGLVRL